MHQSVLVDQEINLQNDAMFKAFMTNPNSREMVSSVISEITGIDKGLLLKASYIDGGETTKRNIQEEQHETDIFIKINNQMQIIVGMNRDYPKNSLEKNVLYVMSKIIDPTIIEMNFGSIIVINIDNVNYYKTDEPILVFQSKDKEGNIEIDSFKSIHIILENCKESIHNVGKETKKFASFLQEKKTINELVNKYKEDEEYMSVIQTIEELSCDSKFAECYAIEEKNTNNYEKQKKTKIKKLKD